MSKSLTTGDPMRIKPGVRLKVLYYFPATDGTPVVPGIYEVLATYPSGTNCIIRLVNKSEPSIQVDIERLRQNAYLPNPDDALTTSNKDAYDEYSMFDPLLPEGRDPIVPKCNHEFTTYVGLSDTFDYCKVCGLKREEITKSESTDKSSLGGRIS